MQSTVTKAPVGLWLARGSQRLGMSTGVAATCNPYEESKKHGGPQAAKKSPVGSFLVFGSQSVGMSTVVAAVMTRTGIEGARPPIGGKQQSSGLLFSARVPTARNVYRGCCWKTPSVSASQIHLPQRGRLLGREAKLCHLNNTAPAESCASVHGSAGAVCHLIGCFPECKPRYPPARRPGRRLRRRSALRGRGSPTGPPWRADGRCGR